MESSFHPEFISSEIPNNFLAFRSFPGKRKINFSALQTRAFQSFPPKLFHGVGAFHQLSSFPFEIIFPLRAQKESSVESEN